MKNKVVSLSRARVARLTPEERIERREAQRRYRWAIRTNEYFEKQHLKALREAVLTKIQDQLRDDPQAISLKNLANSNLSWLIETSYTDEQGQD